MIHLTEDVKGWEADSVDFVDRIVVRAGGPLTSPALLSHLTPAHPGRGGRLQKKKLAFSNPLSPGGWV